ncbi:MAG: hypothetical protein K8U57_01715 [Planctomycetes bacterium]|nr:hypothetical protein [Planctomycetota bacterium]
MIDLAEVDLGENPSNAVLKQIAELAARYPGVTIQRFRESPSVCHIDMNITDSISVARLVRSATVSNIAPVVFTRWCPHTEKIDYSDPLLLIYRFMTTSEVSPKDRHSAMEIFGISITHDLQETGMLGSEEAEAIRSEINDRIPE